MVLRLRESKNKSDLCQSAPLSLFPSPFPKKLFYEALDVQNVSLYIFLILSLHYSLGYVLSLSPTFLGL